MKKYLFIILFAILANSCYMYPSPNVASMNNGDSKLMLSGGYLLKEKHRKEMKDVPIMPFVSYVKKTSKDTTYNFYTWGVQRIQDIYNDDRFNIAFFNSISYAHIFVIGLNMGISSTYKTNYLDLYGSIKLDNNFSMGDFEGKTWIDFLYVMPRIGAKLKLEYLDIFSEVMLVKNVFEKIIGTSKDADFLGTDMIYILNVGISVYF